MKNLILSFIVVMLSLSFANADDLLKVELNSMMGGKTNIQAPPSPEWKYLNNYQKIQMLQSNRAYARFVKSVVPTVGAVGYQPVIVVLPEGTNFSASAVISADRRYVRFSGGLMQSHISKVDTFNFGN